MSSDRPMWIEALESLHEMTMQHCTFGKPDADDSYFADDMALSANEGAIWCLKKLGLIKNGRIGPWFRGLPPCPDCATKDAELKIAQVALTVSLNGLDRMKREHDERENLAREAVQDLDEARARLARDCATKDATITELRAEIDHLKAFGECED